MSLFVLLRPLVDAWIGRRARPQAEALAAVAGMLPAVVVTGGSSGIGLAIAKRFANAGHAVILVAREEAALAAAAETILTERGSEAQGTHTHLAAAAGPLDPIFEINPLNAEAPKWTQKPVPGTSLHGPPIYPLSLDVTDTDAFARIDAFVRAQGYYVDILVNNAGIGLCGEFTTHNPADTDRLLALNVTALTRLMRAALPAMRARARGGILNVASLGGLIPGPYQAAYYASKAYVISLTEAVAAEIAGEGVRMSALAPGPVATHFHAAMGAEHALYRSIMPAASADAVAGAAFRGYWLGHLVIVPGLLGPAFALGARLMPHRLLVPMLGVLLRPRVQLKK